MFKIEVEPTFAPSVAAGAIFIPKGSDEDLTRQRIFYDETYNYLKEIMS